MSRSLIKEPYVAPVLGKQTRGFSLLTHVLSVSVLARSLSWIAASFSSLSWSSVTCTHSDPRLTGRPPSHSKHSHPFICPRNNIAHDRCVCVCHTHCSC